MLSPSSLEQTALTGRDSNSQIVGSLVLFFCAVSRKTASWCSVEELFPWDTVCIEDRTGFKLTDSTYTDSLLLILHGSFMHMSRSNLKVPSQDIAIRFPIKWIGSIKAPAFPSLHHLTDLT